MTRSHAETRHPHDVIRDSLFETAHSVELVLYIVGHTGGCVRYIDIHRCLYGRMIFCDDREITHYQVVRVHAHGVIPDTFFDELGVMYTSLRTTSFHDLVRAHLDDCLDIETHPRLWELHRVAPSMTFVDNSGRLYRRDIGSGSIAPPAMMLAHLIGDPRARVYRGTDHAIYTLTLGLLYSPRPSLVQTPQTHPRQLTLSPRMRSPPIRSPPRSPPHRQILPQSTVDTLRSRVLEIKETNTYIIHLTSESESRP
jgi:hypothetical protein